MKKEIKMRRTLKATAKTAAIGLTLATMLAGSGCSRGSGKYNSMMKSAEEYVQKSDYDSALNCYDIAAKLEPKKAAPLAKMAEVYAEEGEYTKADELIEQAILLVPDNTNVYLTKMNLKLKSGRGYEAYDAMMYAKECGKIEVTPEEYVQMAGLLTGEGHAEEAVDCFSNVSVSDLTPEQQISYWYALKMTGNEDLIASLSLAEPGSEKMPANFDEQFQNGTLKLTKTPIGEEAFGEDSSNNLLSVSPNNHYGVFSTENSYYLYDFENKKKIDIWADTEHSVSGTAEAVERLVSQQGSVLVSSTTWSQNGSYLMVNGSYLMDRDMDRAGATSSMLSDIYVIDVQTGGCYAVKDYAEWTIENGVYPERFCTDNTENTIYYCERNDQSNSYTIMKMNKETGNEEQIAQLSGNEWWTRRPLTCTATGKIGGLFTNQITEDLTWLTWQRENGTWTQSEKEICPKSMRTSDYTWDGEVKISDSGRGIYTTASGVIVFDAEGDEETYVILAKRAENGQSYTKYTLEEGEKMYSNENHDSPAGVCISPDGRYLAWIYGGYNMELEKWEGVMDIVDLETLQSQGIPLDNARRFEWLDQGLINLGVGIYSLNE